MLTDEEIKAIGEGNQGTWQDDLQFARAIESAVLAKLREQESVAWMYQHEDTGLVGFIDQYQLDNGFEKLNPRLQVTTPLFVHPAPIPEAELKAAIRIGAEYAFNLTGLNEGLTIADEEMEECYKAMLAAARSGE